MGDFCSLNRETRSREKQHSQSQADVPTSPMCVSPFMPCSVCLSAFGMPGGCGHGKRSRADPPNGSSMPPPPPHCPWPLYPYLARSSPLYRTEQAGCPAPRGMEERGEEGYSEHPRNCSRSRPPATITPEHRGTGRASGGDCVV